MKHDPAGDVLATTAALWFAGHARPLESTRGQTVAKAAAAPSARPLRPEDLLPWRTELSDLQRQAISESLRVWRAA